jgi:hypothetical protein
MLKQSVVTYGGWIQSATHEPGHYADISAQLHASSGKAWYPVDRAGLEEYNPCLHQLSKPGRSASSQSLY